MAFSPFEYLFSLFSGGVQGLFELTNFSPPEIIRVILLYLARRLYLLYFSLKENLSFVCLPGNGVADLFRPGGPFGLPAVGLNSFLSSIDPFLADFIFGKSAFAI